MYIAYYILFISAVSYLTLLNILILFKIDTMVYDRDTNTVGTGILLWRLWQPMVMVAMEATR